MSAEESRNVSDLDSWLDGEAAWWAKAARAQINIETLRAVVDKYHSLAPYEVRSREIEPGHKFEQAVYTTVPVPSAVKTLAGDAIHNLRSSLDSFVYELARRNHPEMTDAQERATEFPICKDPQSFERFFLASRHRIGLFSDRDKLALRSVQPFAFGEEAEAVGVERGDDSYDVDFRHNEVSRLHAISNLDKHRRLVKLEWIPSIVWWDGDDPDWGWIPGGALREDGSRVLGTLVSAKSEPAMPPKFHAQFDLALLDDSAPQTDVVQTLESWRFSLVHWVLPRMIATLQTGVPPIMISFQPPVPR
jgi:hypothetical protein